MNRNRLFYFRHDVWKKLSEPSLTKIKTSMFEDFKTEAAMKVLRGRKLGYSQLRLLPKEVGARPIMNLRRRTQTNFGNKLVLGRSINSLLRPAFTVLNYEKVRHYSVLVGVITWC